MGLLVVEEGKAGAVASSRKSDNLLRLSSLAIARRRQATIFFEHLCEFGLVFKAYSSADGADGQGGFVKQALGFGDAVIA